MRMDILTINNFSYFAFNLKKATHLSLLDKTIVIVAHVLLSFTAGLGHFITAIVYWLLKKDFEAGFSQTAIIADRTNRVGLPNTINNLAGLNFSEIDHIEVIGGTEGIPPTHDCIIFKRNGQRKSIPSLDNDKFNEIRQNRLVRVIDPIRYSRITMREARLAREMQEKTGLNLSLIDEIEAIALLPANLISCKVTYSTGEQRFHALKNEDFQQIQNAHLPFLRIRTPF
jgi:hypothetical protein